MTNLNVGVYSPWDTDSPQSWSGVVKPMVDALREVANVTIYPPVRQRDAATERIRARIRGLRGRPSLPTHTLATARLRSTALGTQIRSTTGPRPDALLTIAASTDILSVPRDIPHLQVTDATFPAIQGFYPMATGLGRRNERQGLLVERSGAVVTDRYLTATDWAARSLVEDIGVPRHKVRVVPFGPGTPPSDDPRPRSPGTTLRVLAVIADWERKRGDDVLAAVERARRTRDVRLTLVGPIPGQLPPWVDALGVVDRNRLAELYAGHDVLLDLALANAAGVVLTDALTSGLPVIATHVGGVKSIVHDGVTGWLVAPADAVDATARLLTGLDKTAVTHASGAAIEDGCNRLNWRTWATATEDAIRTAIAERGTTAPPALRGRQAVMLTPILPAARGHESAGERLVHDIAQVVSRYSELTMISTDGPANRRALERGVSSTHRVLPPEAPECNRWTRLLGIAPPMGRKSLSQIDALLATADLIDIQWEETAMLLGALRRSNRRTRIVVTLHDVLSQRFARQQDLQNSPVRKAAWACRRAAAVALEHRIVRVADDVVVLSQKDADLLPVSGRRARVHVIPPAISGTLRDRRPSPGEPLLLFVGYMARWENEDAMHWFITEILPTVRTRCPHVRVAVVGGGLRNHVVQELEANNVEVRGFVDDLEPLYQQATAVVVPLRYGAGVKFKVVEALIRGVPTVTTTVGNEGITPHNAAIVADDPQGLAAAIVQVIENPKAAEEYARASAPAVAEEFGETRFRARLQEVYQ